MAGPDAVCPVHGIFTFENFLGGPGAATIAFTNTATNCPRCGRMSPIVDGTYEFVGEVLKAFHAPGVTRETIEVFRDLIHASQNGSITQQQARDDAAKFGASFVSLLDWANTNAGLLTLLLTIIGLFITGYTEYSSDRSSAQQHEDAQQQIAIQQKIYEALRQPHSSDEPQVSPTESKQVTQEKSLQQKPKVVGHGSNRHERRKAASLTRRQPR